MQKLFFLAKGEDKNKYSEYFSRINVEDMEFFPYEYSMNNVEYSSLENRLLHQEEDTLLLIPAIFNSFNAYSYDGVEFAIRLYFKYIIQKKNNFWMIVIGSEEESAFWHHCSYHNFINCNHVDYVKNNLFLIRDFLQRILPNRFLDLTIDWDICKEKIKEINIRPPASYKTHHSITNEWSVYRWSKCLGIDDIPVSKDIDDFLYFNYLKAIYPYPEIDKQQFDISGEGRVLLIDDECKKGWHVFFKTLFSSNSKIQFDSIGADFKNQKPKQIIDSAIKKISDFKPTVIILDLRLDDTDFEVTDPKELIGAQILKCVKNDINKGIQVILFSASNKVWNYLPLASDGVMVKESPETDISNGATVTSLSDFSETITNCLKKGHWLTGVYEKMKRIESLINSSGVFGDNEDEVLSNISVAFELLGKNDYELIPKYLAYSYLQLYIILEKYLQVDSIFKIKNNEARVFEKFIVARWNRMDNNSKKYIVDYAITSAPNYKIGCNTDTREDWNKTHFRMSSILLFGYGVKNVGNSDWRDINYVRNNKAGHPEKGDISSNEYEQLLDFMIFIFDKRNIRYMSIDYSLPLISSATVTLSGRDCQAKINDNTANLPIQFYEKKPKLTIGDVITVEIITKNGKPVELHYVNKPTYN